MSASRTQPPWGFLLTASRNTPQSCELSRLSHAANLRKEISSLLDQWLDENTAAMLAQWLIRQREISVLGPEQPPAAESSIADTNSASDNPLADRFAAHNGSRMRLALVAVVSPHRFPVLVALSTESSLAVSSLTASPTCAVIAL